MGKLSKIALILIKLFNTGTARTAKPGVGNMKNKLIYESMMTSKPKQCNLVPTILFPEFTLFVSVPRSTTSQRIMTISTCLSDLLRKNWLNNCDNTDRSDSGVTLSDDECLWVTLGVITVSHQSWETVTFFLAAGLNVVIWQILSPAVHMKFWWKLHAWEISLMLAWNPLISIGTLPLLSLRFLSHHPSLMSLTFLMSLGVAKVPLMSFSSIDINWHCSKLISRTRAWVLLKSQLQDLIHLCKEPTDLPFEPHFDPNHLLFD